jgi:hypothetical protein
MSQEDIKQQIHRYFVAVYGINYVYAAPETFGNVLERWMLAVVAENNVAAEEYMSAIEQMAAVNKRGTP